MLSDTSVENDVTPALYPKRSASALGAAGGYRQPLQGSKSVEHMRDGTNLNGSRGQANHLKSSLHSREFALEPLSEDEVGGGGAKFDRHLRPGRKADSFLSPKFGPENRDPPRPASAAQVRDLKDQMKDLKGKISSLREQARADSLKRRSFQSLRSESPFTQGGTEQWYAGRGASAGIGGSTPSSVRNPWNGEESSVDGDNVPQSRHLAAQDREAEEDEESIISGYTEGEQTGPTKVSRVPVQVTVSHLHESGVTVDEGVAEVVEGSEFDEVDVADMDDMQTEDGYDDELQGNGAADYESESGESLYHDTMQTPLSHEDREDAFDYEHFFLHSAMGTISQQRLARRGSTSSLGSDDSVETTRGPIVSNEGKPNGMVRRGSTASTTTMESFATADEGRSVKSRGATPPKATDKRPKTPDTAQCDKSASRRISDEGSSSSGSVNGSGAGRGGHQRQNSVIHVGAGDRRPASVSAAALSLHRPSVSSFESTGTQRSFPLVNKAKLLQQQAAATVTNAGQASASSAATGVLTPQGSPDPAADMRRLSDNTFFSDTSSILSVGGKGAGTGAAMQSLSREDQLLVERLVASLGRCVLGLTEAPRGTAESREFRRRIDLARRLLEGSEEMG